MSRSETGSPTTNSYIERQKELLRELDEQGIPDPPLPPTTETVPPPVPPVEAAVPPVPPAEPTSSTPPVVSVASVEPPAPSLDIAQLQSQVANLQHQLDSALGRLVPVQNQVSALLRENGSLKTQLASLQTARGNQAPGSTPPAAPLPPAQAVEEDDPELKEFQETYQDLIPGLNRFIEKRLKPIQTQIQPVVQQQQMTQEERDLAELRWEHLKPVRAKYANARDIVASQDFEDHLGRLPSWAKANARAMFSNPELYPTEDLIAFLDDYTKARGTTPEPPASTTQPPVTPDPTMLLVEPRRIPSVPVSSQPAGPVQLTKERLRQIDRILVDNAKNPGKYKAEDIAALRAEMDAGELASVQLGRGAAPSLQTMLR